MHRALAIVLVAALAGGCGHVALDEREDYVQRLRIKITQARHAVEATRRAIARSAGAKQLPELHVRVAELLAEEASYHYRLAYEREGRSSRVLHVPEVRLLKERAVATYWRVLRDHPDSPLAPRILFNIGHELRELGKYDAMHAALTRLVEEHPKSPRRAEALIVLGDYHFDRSQLTAARVWYEKAAGGPVSPTSALAWYKLAWVGMNEGECDQALPAFEKAIEYARGVETVRRTDALGAQADIDVRREALVDMTYCYSRDRDAKGVTGWFRERAPDRETWIAALSRLIKRYEVLDRPEGVVETARALLATGPADPSRLDDARVLYAAIRKSSDWSRVGEDAGAILRVMRRATRRADLSDEERQAVRDEFERYARDLVTRAHEAAKKSKAPALQAQVAIGYRAWLDTFTASEQRFAILENQGDVLFAMGRNLEAGRHYAELARVLEPGGQRDGANYDAVVAFQNAIEAPGTRALVDRVSARSGLRRAARALIGTELPAEKMRRIKFATALTWYDEGRLREAIDRFTAVAYEYPQSDQANRAVHIVLDAFGALDDMEGMMQAGRRFLLPSSPVDATTRAELLPIVAAAEQAFLDRISLKAAGDEGESYEFLEEFATKNEGTSLGERALINAFVAARANGDTDKLFQLAERLEREYPKSEQLPGLLVALAQMSVATWDLDRGIAYLGKAARLNPERAVALTIAAGRLREQLGDAKGAMAAYVRASDLAGDTPARGSAVRAIASLVERIESPATVVTTLQPLADGQDPEVLARLGLALARLGRIDDADMALGTVLGGTEPASAQARARAKYGSAETLLTAVEGFPQAADIDAFQEYVMLAEVAEQGFVTAAQAGDPMFTGAALARLARLAQVVRQRLEMAGPPPGLSAGEQAAVRDALKQRVENLKAVEAQALRACTRQAWRGRVFEPPVRGCLEGKVPTSSPVVFDRLKPRKSQVRGLEEKRAAVGRDPDDAAALRALGEALLDGGDPHTSRLVLARISELGGGPEDANLLGLAHYGAGDVAGALGAFARAADGGLEAGRQNLATALRELGLVEAAARALKVFGVGRVGGRLLGGQS